MAARPHILMLVGSYATREMAELSELYARGCERALGEDFRFTTLHRDPEDGGWRVAADVEAARATSPSSFAEAAARLSHETFAAALPQMFCLAGMTRGRERLLDLGMPMIGNSPEVMALGADKARTRDVVRSAGLNVPEGVVVPKGEMPSDLPAFPVIVKPVASDNSDGLSLVRGEAQLATALSLAHIHGDALVEAFIAPGRELRCGVIERAGRLLALRPEEYPVDPKRRPIRTRDDKLARGAGGQMRLVAKTRERAWMVAPDDPVVTALQQAARDAFRAMGCRDYGLFDFRVDDAGAPWFLEAGLYCSFSPDSVVAAMAAADGMALPDLLDGFLPGAPPARPTSQPRFEAA